MSTIGRKIPNEDEEFDCAKINSAVGTPKNHNRPSYSDFSKTVCPPWSYFTDFSRECITAFVVSLAVHAARHPKKYIFSVLVVSFALIAAGFFTNFNINTDEQVIYAPFKSKPKSHSEWIENKSGFPGNSRIFTVALHADGKNVLGAKQIRRVFDVVNEVRNTPGYGDVCRQADYVNFNGVQTCKITSVTRFFKDNVTIFENVYRSGGEEAIIRTVSADTYENHVPVDRNLILGKPQTDPKTGLLNSTLTYNLYFNLPNLDVTRNLEAAIIKRMKTMREVWDHDDNLMKLEFFAQRSYSDEFARAIAKDLFLLPIVFFTMVGFTCLVFFRRHKIQSRTLMGLGSVVTIMCSLMTSFGIMFLIGIPFTNMTEILPFVVFGVGLDDTFVIMGAYQRTDPNKEPEERIRETMEEIGLSISVTTITTMFAFMLGCMSTIPAIFWLNLYAFPTIFIDFIYQITFFTALLVLDERRIQAKRLDCCICITAKNIEDDSEPEEVTPSSDRTVITKTTQEKFMSWYARFLMRPWVKFIVIVIFLLYAAGCAYSTTLLNQEFDLKDLLPAESYVRDFLDVTEEYSSTILGVGIYFRGDFDQLDPDMQQQMETYVDELSELPQFAAEPPFCWFRDLKKFQNSSLAEQAAAEVGLNLTSLTMREKVKFAFTVPAIKETYGQHVVFDGEGRITASRCFTYIVKINLDVVKDQIDLLKEQRAITEEQPVNQNTGEWSFFTFTDLYFIWEFYSVAVMGLTSNTVEGVVAVCFVCFFFIPHWGSIFFACPLICILYVDLLGTLQFAGLHINAVTYICLVISIGLLVDFIVHVLLRYYESKALSREEKVKDTLETMGASILVGGISTFLGVIPMAFSTSKIMGTVFTCFLAMIILGLLHGVILLPVVLSIFGPEEGGHLPSSASFETRSHDLELKKEGSVSETDNSNEVESYGVSGGDPDVDFQQPLEGQQSFDTAALHAFGTFREEGLEAVYRHPNSNKLTKLEPTIAKLGSSGLE